MIAAVLFDFGFTLINFEGNFYQSLSESYRLLAQSLVDSGLNLDPEDFAQKFEELISEYYQTREIDLIERPVEEFLQMALAAFGYEHVSDSILQNALTEMYQETERNWQLEPDARNTLELLRKRGYRLGLITNAANAPDSNRLIDRFELRSLFDVILISADERIRKPDTQIFSRALMRLGVSPEQAVMVGDTLTADILGAQNAGLYGIWIRRRALRPENESLPTRIRPDAVIDRLDELPDAILSLAKKNPAN